MFDVYVTAGFGVAGYVFARCGMEPAPLLLGFVLGPMMEENLRRALLLSRGDFGTLVERPLSASLLAATVAMVLVVALPAIRKTREAAFQETRTAARARRARCAIRCATAHPYRGLPQHLRRAA